MSDLDIHSMFRILVEFKYSLCHDFGMIMKFGQNIFVIFEINRTYESLGAKGCIYLIIKLIFQYTGSITN